MVTEFKDGVHKKGGLGMIPRNNDDIIDGDNLERDIIMKEMEDKKHRSCKLRFLRSAIFIFVL
jgi:hypothetical protein